MTGPEKFEWWRQGAIMFDPLAIAGCIFALFLGSVSVCPADTLSAPSKVTQGSLPPVPPMRDQLAASDGPLLPERERALQPKDHFTECDNCPELVVVPAGSFMMGPPNSEAFAFMVGAPNGGQGQRSDEGLQHTVTIEKPLAVGRFAVTFEEWDACVADGGCTGYKPADQGWGRGQRPVINVSWNDIQSYLTWLSRKTGKPYRLLSGPSGS